MTTEMRADSPSVSTSGAGRGAAPDRRIRVLVALLIGCMAFVFAYAMLAQAHGLAGDFTSTWRAAWALARGQDPYAVIVPSGRWPFDNPWYYPLPAALVAVPFMWLPPSLAGPAFFGLSSGAAAYLLSREGFARFAVFLTPCYLSAVLSAQWAPFLMFATLAPSVVGCLLVCKPTVGLAGFAYRPSIRRAVASLALVAITVLLWPGWPRHWYTTVAQSPYARIALLQFVGPVLLLALTRWRRPEARLLLALACVPHSLFWYDEMLLWLVPRTQREALNLTWCSWAGYLLWLAVEYFRRGQLILATGAPWLVCFVYVPCLVMVLRRPNEGEVAPWLQRFGMRASRAT